MNYIIVFVAKAASISELKKYKLSDSTIFITEEHYLKYVLDSEGFENVFYIDSFIENNVAERYNKITHEYALHWFRDENDNDVFKYNNVELGESFYWIISQHILIPFFKFFLSFINIKKQYDINKVILDDNEDLLISVFKILSIQYSFLKESSADDKDYLNLVTYKYKSVAPKSFLFENKISNAKTFIKSIFRKVKRLFSYTSGKTYNILVSQYFPTKPVIEKMENCKTKKIFNIYEIDAFDFGFSQNVVSTEELTQIKSFLDSEFYLEKFVFEGFNCGPFLKDFFYKTISNHFNAFKLYLKVCINFLEHNKINLFFTAVDGEWRHKIIVNACKRMSIPTIIIMNGVILDKYQQEAKKCDYNLAYSQYIRACYYNNSINSYSIGNPYFDKYAKFQTKKITHKKTYNVMVNPITYHPGVVNCSKHLEEDYLCDILNVLDSHKNNFNVFIKPHPATNVESLNYFLNYYKFYDVTIIKGNFNEVIKIADLYISNWSTTNFEAAMIGIPVIYYKKDCLEYYAPYNAKCEQFTAQKVDELDKLIIDFLNSPYSLLRFSNKKILEKYIGHIDGHNTERVCNFISRVLKKHVRQN